MVHSAEAKATSRAIEARRAALVPTFDILAQAKRLANLRALGAIEIYIMNEDGTGVWLLVEGDLHHHGGGVGSLPEPVTVAITQHPESGDLDGYLWEGRPV